MGQPIQGGNNVDQPGKLQGVNQKLENILADDQIDAAEEKDFTDILGDLNAAINEGNDEQPLKDAFGIETPVEIIGENDEVDMIPDIAIEQAGIKGRNHHRNTQGIDRRNP